MEFCRIAGRCAFILFFAILIDLTGVILLLLGLFAKLSYWDFFLYSGALALALSIVFWIFWYTFNVEVSHEELELDF